MTDSSGSERDSAKPAKPAQTPHAGSASRAILGQGSLYTLATAAPALAAVAVLPVVTRVVPPEEYDLIAVCTVIVQVGFILAALGMGAAITRQYILVRDGADGARGLVVQAALMATGVAALAAFGARFWSPALLGRPSSIALLLAITSCLGGAWVVVSQSFLRGANRVGVFVLLAVGGSLFGPVLGLLLAVAVQPTAAYYLAGVAIGFSLAGVAGIVIVVRSGHVDLSGTGLTAALRIGLPTVPHQVSLYLALAGLVVIADRILGQGGQANIVLTIGAGATVITAAMNNAWAPVIYRTPPGRRAAVLTETTHTIATLAVAIAGVVALLSPWLLQLAAPASFQSDDLASAVALASAASLPSVYYLASGHLVFTEGRTGWLAVSTPVAVLVGLLWAEVSAPRWGMVAVASGYLVAYLMLATLTTLVQRRVSSTVWWPPFLPWHLLVWCGVTILATLPSHGALAMALRAVCALVLLAAAAVALRGHIAPQPSGGTS